MDRYLPRLGADSLKEASQVEYSTSPSRLRRGLARGFPPVAEDGTIPVPDGPGLGVALNADVVDELSLSRGAGACR